MSYREDLKKKAGEISELKAKHMLNEIERMKKVSDIELEGNDYDYLPDDY